MSASVAAARRGAQVILIEKYGFLGGLATTARVGTICGLPPGEEVLERADSSLRAIRDWLGSLARASGTKVITLPGELEVLPYDSWVFRRLADDWLASAEGVTPLLHATLAEVQVAEGQSIEANALIWDRLVGLRARSLVDCSGTATAIRLAGGTVREATPPSTPGVIFSMDGMEDDLEELGTRLSILREIARAVAAGELSSTCASASFVPGSASRSRVDIKLSIDVPPTTSSWRRISELELEARRAVGELAEFLVRKSATFKRARLGRVATQVGTRCDGLVLGRHTLTEAEVCHGARFEDGVAWGTWPIEQWRADGRPRLRHLCDEGYYEIPLRCMRAADLENVWMAGRCLSADEPAQASARVIGTALQTGWAAGTAAADNALNRPESDTTASLRGELT